MIAGLLVGLAVLVAHPPPARRRWRALRTGTSRPRPDPSAGGALLLPLAAWVVFGPAGAVLAVGAVPWLRARLSSLESERDRRRHAAALRQLPVVLDLIAAVLEAGRGAHEAVRIVATRTDPPVGDELVVLAHRVRIAADPIAAWRALDGTVLEPLGRAVARSERSGAAIAPLIRETAREARRRRRAVRREIVARVGVRTAAPLGLCLLPSFVLVGIAPTVIGMLATFRP